MPYPTGMTMREMMQKMIRGEIPHPPVARLVGFEVVKCEVGTSTLTLETSSKHYNPMGTVHGGVLL